MEKNETIARMIFVRPMKVIVLHWFNAVCWILLTFSGLGIIRGDMRFMPSGFAEWMQRSVGGPFSLIVGHSLLGLFWAAVLLIFARANLHAVVLPFLKEVISLTPRSILADLKSMAVTIARLFGAMKNVELPPEGRYNGAQRLLGTMILFSGAAIVLTGITMFFIFLFTGLMIGSVVFRWSLVAHAFFVGLVWIGLMAHLYYSLVEASPSLEAMKSGYLDVEYIKHHSPGWYDELKKEGKV